MPEEQGMEQRVKRAQCVDKAKTSLLEWSDEAYLVV